VLKAVVGKRGEGRGLGEWGRPMGSEQTKQKKSTNQRKE